MESTYEGLKLVWYDMDENSSEDSCSPKPAQVNPASLRRFPRPQAFRRHFKPLLGPVLVSLLSLVITNSLRFLSRVTHKK